MNAKLRAIRICKHKTYARSFPPFLREYDYMCNTLRDASPFVRIKSRCCSGYSGFSFNFLKIIEQKYMQILSCLGFALMRNWLHLNECFFSIVKCDLVIGASAFSPIVFVFISKTKTGLVLVLLQFLKGTMTSSLNRFPARSN